MNKTIVITGAGGVLCSSFAEALAADGAKVALLDLNEEAAKKVADRINAAGGTARAYGTNVLERESLKAAHEAILADLGVSSVRYPDQRSGRKQSPLHHRARGF